ncbi:hypothetical protein QEH56_02720 [Pelagicoccus enzymogenes]|uniref:hypothetical protein n=1 Tax=Pelagicoccus enzymogenes TaxID=2773457 RepID=UPI00280D6F96|nr:hypothetical protein [Pelagicoccus enzymogenes]MDQ8197041.1 hypothetical protein [Pelagicoccus enzymogenes]
MNIKSFPILASLAAIVFLSGCATPSRVSQMTILATDAIGYTGETPLKENVSVDESTGGHNTNPLWTSQVSSDDFKQALEDSLASVQLLHPQKSGKYRLSLELQKLKQPFVGINMTVTASVNYKLTHSETNQVLFEETIETPFTATVSDAFIGVERLKIANEGAVRENIKMLIGKLYELEVSESQVTVE